VYTAQRPATAISAAYQCEQSGGRNSLSSMNGLAVLLGDLHLRYLSMTVNAIAHQCRLHLRSRLVTTLAIVCGILELNRIEGRASPRRARGVITPRTRQFL